MEKIYYSGINGDKNINWFTPVLEETRDVANMLLEGIDPWWKKRLEELRDKQKGNRKPQEIRIPASDLINDNPEERDKNDSWVREVNFEL